MSKNQQYAEQYADFAMEQMRKYGIPASVTLAQGILESSNGQSRLALNENNHFGIKATPRWIAQGGKYGLYTDDKPNEKFCSYDSVGDSYEHHSRFLVENKRYDRCFALAPDDYKGWTEGLAKAGYASGSNYAGSLQKIIEVNGLQKYDRMVMAETKTQRLEIGQEMNVDANKEAYSFPVERAEFMFVTSPFGMRTDPMDAGKQQMHKGIDIRCKGDAVLATENNGKVVAVNQNANTAGGKSITIEYPRSDGSKVQNTYMHLSSVDVKVGDTVRNWNGLGVQLTSVFHLTQDPVQPAGYEYLGVRVTTVNRSKTESYAIGAQGIDAINEAYPVPPLENVDANFQAMAAATPDFTAVCDGQPAACCAHISLYNANSQSFSDVESLPPQGSAYIVLMLMVPKDWKQLKVTYVPTFLEGKSLTFVMNASDVIRS